MSTNQQNNKKTQNSKFPKAIPNPMEAMKDIGAATAQQMRQEIAQIPQDMFNQLLGFDTPSVPPRSGELLPGESMEMSEVMSVQYEENNAVRQQINYERMLLSEEKAESQKKTNELKMQLSQVQRELIQIAQSTESLAQETEIAAMSVAVDPGVYHVIFFEKLLEFVKSFRKKINQANVWLSSANKRAQKKGWAANYKQHGAKYLLSGEHYVARSAG